MDRLTEQQELEIRERLEKTTPGDTMVATEHGDFVNHGHYSVVIEDEAEKRLRPRILLTFNGNFPCEGDSAFYANSKQDITALLAELATLRVEKKAAEEKAAALQLELDGVREAAGPKETIRLLGDTYKIIRSADDCETEDGLLRGYACYKSKEICLYGVGKYPPQESLTTLWHEILHVVSHKRKLRLNCHTIEQLAGAISMITANNDPIRISDANRLAEAVNGAEKEGVQE